MEIKDFKSGTYNAQTEYKTFSPAAINHVWTWSNPLINVLLEDANKALGELNASYPHRNSALPV